jgi:hypothetical protein
MAARWPRGALALLIGVCLAAQVASAAWVPRSFETPNESTTLARQLVASGELVVGGARAYQLPGEPLYLAVAFRYLPAGLWPYVHVPVVTAFVVAVALIGFAAGGWTCGLAAGLVASVDPFVLIHGPVWDDTFLAAAMEFAILAAVMSSVERGAVSLPSAAGIAAASGLAAVTRLHSQVLLVLFGAALVLMPALRRVRPAGVAVLCGVAIALAAWGARNELVLGEFFVGSSHDGKTAFESNCAGTRRNLSGVGHIGGAMDACSADVTAHAAALPELEQNRAFTRAAWQFVGAHPAVALRTAAVKTAVSLTGFNPAAPWSGPRNVLMAAGSVALLLAGLIGLWSLRTAAGGVLGVFAGLTVFVTLAMLMAGPTGARYRLSLSGLLFLGAGAVLAEPRMSVLSKRALDVALSGVGLVASLPVWAIVAAFVKLEDGGPAFYGQERVGENGRVFQVLKFRSMVPDAEAVVGALQASVHDPRVTRVGRWLRATAAD